MGNLEDRIREIQLGDLVWDRLGWEFKGWRFKGKVRAKSGCPRVYRYRWPT